MAGLTEKLKIFCEYIVEGKNGKEAAKLVGVDEKNARFRARDWLKRDYVKAHLAELRAHWREELGINPERVIKELAAIAFSNVKDSCEWNDSGITLKESAELEAHTAAAIKDVRYHFSDGVGQVRVTMHDKVAALEKLGRHLGLFKDEDASKVPVEIKVVVEPYKA